MATSKKLWSDDFGGKINNSVSHFYELVQLLIYSVCM